MTKMRMGSERNGANREGHWPPRERTKSFERTVLCTSFEHPSCLLDELVKLLVFDCARLLHLSPWSSCCDFER